MKKKFGMAPPPLEKLQTFFKAYIVLDRNKCNVNYEANQMHDLDLQIVYIKKGIFCSS